MDDYELINENRRRIIVENIIEGILNVLKLNRYALNKIRANITIISLQLLGKKIKKDKTTLFVYKCVEKILASLPKRGDTVGIIAGQSLTQPITQAVLKAQHSAGKAQEGSSTSLIALNRMQMSTRYINIHYKKLLTLGETIDFSKKLERISIGELLKSTYGSTKYTPKPFTPPSENKFSVYIKVSRDIGKYPPKISYGFTMDSEKLFSTGLTHIDIFEKIIPISGVGIIVYPLSTFCFDLVPVDIDQIVFLEKIEQILNIKITGIDGVSRVETISLKTKDFAKFVHYDKDTLKTHIYLNSEMVPFFPIEIFKTFLENNNKFNFLSGAEINDPYPLRLVYNGEITIPDKEYHYTRVTGTITVSMITNELKDIINSKYTTSNDPNEMISIVGIQGARSMHEYMYLEELNASGHSISYLHVSILCSKLFSGMGKKPITPTGFITTSGINPIDRFTYQDYKNALSTETRSNKRYTVNGLIPSVITGSIPREGTNYMYTAVNNDERKKIIDMYSEARSKQYYYGNSSNTHFYGIGTVNSLVQSLKKNIKFANENLEGF